MPAALGRFMAELRDPAVNTDRLASTIESDVGLAAALLQGVNSAACGLAAPVGSVPEALIYLGARSVAATALRIALRAAFPASAKLEGIWRRSAERADLMVLLARALALEPWSAHSAGLFAECGKAILFRHAPQVYGTLLDASATDSELVRREGLHFGQAHDSLGAALCQSWGLAPAAIQAVRYRVAVYDSFLLPRRAAEVCAVLALAQVIMDAPERVEPAVGLLSAQLHWDRATTLAGVSKAQRQWVRAAA